MGSPESSLNGSVISATVLPGNGVAGALLKRLLDVLLSLVGLILSAPIWVAISAAIWLESGAPILIFQERSGRGGKPFKSIKFRSMIRNADQFNFVEDLEDDPRVTRVGRLLRKTALDELPQLLNILRGDMSFVGPRALYPVIEDKEKIRYRRIEEIPGFTTRSSVRPGLTGLAQVYAPRDVPRRHKFRYDLIYVKKQSLWLDLKLIALSFWITFTGKWESRERKL